MITIFTLDHTIMAPDEIITIFCENQMLDSQVEEIHSSINQKPLLNCCGPITTIDKLIMSHFIELPYMIISVENLYRPSS